MGGYGLVLVDAAHRAEVFLGRDCEAARRVGQVRVRADWEALHRVVSVSSAPRRDAASSRGWSPSPDITCTGSSGLLATACHLHSA